jgi:SPP1 family predicted phage head-tail adaptor
MKLPKDPNTGIRHFSSDAFNCYVTILQPNAGQGSDGTPNQPTTVAQNIHANMSPWRSKEEDKPQSRVGLSSYKIVIRYPKTYSLDSGMQIMLRNQLHNIESFYDPDGQRAELHIYTFVTDDTVNA